ncbi:MAG: carboxyl transferase domain-containing protein [Planctomycetaceae bacterium]
MGEKRGQLEVADIVAVNKADLPGTDTVITDLRHQVSVPVLKVSVARQEGVAELWQAIEQKASSLSIFPEGEAGHLGQIKSGSHRSNEHPAADHRSGNSVRVQSINSNSPSSLPESERTPVPGLRPLTEQLLQQESLLCQSKESSGKQRPGKPSKLPVRKRLAALLDSDRPFFELGLWAAHGMYTEWGDVPAAGLVAGIGWVNGRPCLVAANDAAVKSGAMFPQSVKKMLRMQKIAYQFRLPLVYLVDSAGVFLPLQDEIFPDEDDFGRIFRNNAVLSAAGIPQFAAVMGNCIAGGAYLPVLSDKILMTEGSQMCLAGPALVKAAIGQDVDPEELGGAAMHASISGTVDFHEPDDPSCLNRLRSLIALLPEPKTTSDDSQPEVAAEQLYDIVSSDGQTAYDVHDVLKCIVDAGSLQEFKAEYGQTLVTTFARIGGRAVGIVASQKQRCRSAAGELQIGGVIYDDAADKAARFVMDCNQTGLPIIFFQDVQGFIVGKRAEQSGIIRAGAKLVNVVSNSIVPKLTVILGGSFGAGNYALCGKAYDPALILAWPSARYAVMGASQAADTLLALRIRDAERKGKKLSPEETTALKESISSRYVETTDIRYGAARGWVDAIIAPHETRKWLAAA